MSTLSARLANPAGTAAAWTSANPTLLAGEIGVESDTGKFKVGDGATAWTALAYSEGGVGAVDSVNGETGTVVLDAADVSADPAGTAASAVSTHEGEADPHSGAYVAPTDGDGVYLAYDAGNDASAARPTTPTGANYIWFNTPSEPINIGMYDIWTSATEIGGAVDSVNGETGTVVLDAADVGAVATTGDETVAGVKTFSSSPIVPAPTTNLQAATKKYVDDNAGGGGGAGATVVIKPADESVTSSTTLQDDNDLSFAIGANEDWVGGFYLFVTGTTGDFQLAINVPAGCTIIYHVHGSTRNDDILQYQSSASTTSNGVVLANLGNTSVPYLLQFSVRNGATAGTVQLRWAQGTSSGTASTIYAGSYLVAHQAS